MAWPEITNTTMSWDRTKTTEGRQVDSVLWPMLCAKSQMLDAVKYGSQIDEPKIEWVSAQTNGRTVTCSNTTDTTIDGSATNQVLVVTDASKLEKGAILRNASVATPLGTYKVDEIMQVTGISGNTLTLTRDYGRNGATPGQGSTAHVAGNTYEVLFTNKEEGSAAGVNLYKPTTVSYNYTSILDMNLVVSGTELARRPLVAADNIQRQYEDRMVELKNSVSSMIMYGASNYGGGTAESMTVFGDVAGTDAYVRTTKGVLQALAQSGGNTDYTSTAVTETGINNLFETILNNGCERVAPYKIFVHPKHMRTIAQWGADKVRIERTDKQWGRYVTSYVSDLGFEAEIIADPIIAKSNLFLLNMDKIEFIPFRPWQKLEWGITTSTPDGTDAYKMRVLGEYTVKVVDPLKAHGCMTLLSWT